MGNGAERPKPCVCEAVPMTSGSTRTGQLHVAMRNRGRGWTLVDDRSIEDGSLICNRACLEVFRLKIIHEVDSLKREVSLGPEVGRARAARYA